MSSTHRLMPALAVVALLVGCATTGKEPVMSEAPGRIVTATYRVAVERQPEFLELLRGCEATMRQEGLVTGRTFVRMRSAVDPELLVELFEWVDATAFDRAQENPRVLQWWGQYEAAWKDGGFGLDQVPEAAMPWAQYEPVE